MQLETIKIEQLQDEEELDKAVKEAYEYGVNRGRASALRYNMFGSLGFDVVLKDYLVKKFGISNSLIEISELIQKIPEKVTISLREGFDKGYLEQASRNRQEDDDDFLFV